MTPSEPAQAAPSASTLSILETLLAFDTTSRNSNLSLIRWVQDYLAPFGAEMRLTFDAEKRKANLFATIGGGPLPGWIFSGHTDVVPVDGQNWASSPFTAHVRDGNVYGRGACDMKGFIACVLAAVPRMLAAGSPAPFHLALSYDEEIGCIGVRDMLADLADRRIRPAACIVGEPTMMGLVVAHKGRREMCCRVRGREAHSSRTDLGINAIEHGAHLIAQVQRLAEMEAGSGYRDPGFELPYTTLQCSMVTGGIAPNTVPGDCRFNVEARYLPGQDAEGLFDRLRSHGDAHILPKMRAGADSGSIEWTLVNDSPPFAIPPSDPLVAFMQEMTSSDRLQRVAYSTEAGLFQNAGIRTIICGPGSIEQAHRPDEFVSLAQLAACEAFLDRVIDSGIPRGFAG